MGILCDFCNTEYDDEDVACPSCGAANPLQSNDLTSDEETPAEVDAAEALAPEALRRNLLQEHVDSDGEIEETTVVPIFRAPNETVANIVKSILESEGIPVTVASRQVPWMDGVMTMGEGFYGDLLVLGSDAERARHIIEVYQSQARQEEEIS